jgi:hypothetical protein
MHLTWCLRVQVEALDRDAGENGRVEYSLMETASTKGRFRIHPHSGIVYAQKSLAAGQEFSFSVSFGNFLLFERTISTNRRPVLVYPFSSSSSSSRFTRVGKKFFLVAHLSPSCRLFLLIPPPPSSRTRLHLAAAPSLAAPATNGIEWPLGV